MGEEEYTLYIEAIDALDNRDEIDIDDDEE